MANQPTVIKFFAPVIDATINALMQAIDQRLGAGQRNFIILVSSPGGSVFHGLSAYNYLKGLPANISTHNFGSVDSIGVVLYCAGRKRFCVPQARFLLHGVSAGFPQGANLEEKQLEERLKGLRIDIENIAKVVAANTGKSVDDVTRAMLDRTTLNPRLTRKKPRPGGSLTKSRPSCSRPDQKSFRSSIKSSRDDIWMFPSCLGGLPNHAVEPSTGARHRSEER